ncbi:MAG: hypothetical protein IKE24_06540 [Clostridia bacterium]|nr:hypothetical protein [Clostridia bacterium]
MPYFERTDSEAYARRFENPEGGEANASYDEFEEDYDDGFEELLEDPEAEGPIDPEEARLQEEEARRSRQEKYVIATGLGDFVGVLLGVAVILLLLAFLISMLRFVSSDFSRTFSLWQLKF